MSEMAALADSGSGEGLLFWLVDTAFLALMGERGEGALSALFYEDTTSRGVVFRHKQFEGIPTFRPQKACSRKSIHNSRCASTADVLREKIS